MLARNEKNAQKKCLVKPWKITKKDPLPTVPPDMVVPKNIEDSSRDTKETRNNNTSAVIQTDLKGTSKKWTEKKIGQGLDKEVADQTNDFIDNSEHQGSNK